MSMVRWSRPWVFVWFLFSRVNPFLVFLATVVQKTVSPPRVVPFGWSSFRGVHPTFSGIFTLSRWVGVGGSWIRVLCLWLSFIVLFMLLVMFQLFEVLLACFKERRVFYISVAFISTTKLCGERRSEIVDVGFFFVFKVRWYIISVEVTAIPTFICLSMCSGDFKKLSINTLIGWSCCISAMMFANRHWCRSCIYGWLWRTITPSTTAVTRTIICVIGDIVIFFCRKYLHAVFYEFIWFGWLPSFYYQQLSVVMREYRKWSRVDWDISMILSVGLHLCSCR